ncbi:MAG: hypothetical protein Q8O67_31580 [Deltaproteobacteria bacterium]|nr:hypothetical protein [Deltaproteobacteria bacterium]
MSSPFRTWSPAAIAVLKRCGFGSLLTLEAETGGLISSQFGVDDWGSRFIPISSFEAGVFGLYIPNGVLVGGQLLCVYYEGNTVRHIGATPEQALLWHASRVASDDESIRTVLRLLHSDERTELLFSLVDRFSDDFSAYAAIGAFAGDPRFTAAVEGLSGDRSEIENTEGFDDQYQMYLQELKDKP